MVSINLNIENLKDSLIKTLNTSNLPIGVAIYVLKDVYGMLLQEYQRALNNEKQQLTKSEVIEYNITPDEDTIIVTEE